MKHHVMTPVVMSHHRLWNCCWWCLTLWCFLWWWETQAFHLKRLTNQLFYDRELRKSLFCGLGGQNKKETPDAIWNGALYFGITYKSLDEKAEKEPSILRQHRPIRPVTHLSNWNSTFGVTVAMSPTPKVLFHWFFLIPFKSFFDCWCSAKIYWNRVNAKKEKERWKWERG